MSTISDTIVSIARRAYNRDNSALADYVGLGFAVKSGEVTYDTARDELVAAFKSFHMSPATARVYLTQGTKVAAAFEDIAAVRKYADEHLKGSRSLKKVYDSLRASEDEGEGEGEDESAEVATVTDADRAASILSILSAMSDAVEIAKVRDAAASKLAA